MKMIEWGYKTMQPKIVEHISIIVKDINRTESFYSRFLGSSILKNENLVVFKVGDTRIFFKLSPTSDTGSEYNKDGIGMNHIGFGVETMDELKQFQQFLSEQGVECSEIKTGKFGNEYVWFDDPDGIRLEIYRG